MLDDKYLEELRRLVRWTRALTLSQYVLMLVLIAHAWMVKGLVK